MKGKKKLIVPLLLAGVTATGVVANIQQTQNQQVQAAASEINNVEGAELRIKPFLQDSYTVGQKVYLPSTEVVGGTEAEETLLSKPYSGYFSAISNINLSLVTLATILADAIEYESASPLIMPIVL